MSNYQPGGLKNFLEERHLTRTDNSVYLAKVRQRFEQSRLLEILQDTCAEINREAQTVVIEGQSYLPPQPIVCTFVFTKASVEYVLQIEVRGPKPRLVFLIRKWHDSSFNPLVRWLCRLAQLRPVTVNIKFSSSISDENVRKDDVEQWFLYLLSGLNSEFTPPQASLGDSAPGPTKDGGQTSGRAAAAGAD